MKSTELIHSLTANLTPVKILKYGLKEYSVVLIAGLFSVLAGVAITGIRADIQNIALTTSFITQSITLLLLGILSTLSAMQMSIPSLKKNVSQKIVVSTLLFWTVTIVYLLLNSNSPFAGWGFSCASEIVINSIIPSAAIFFFTRKSAILDRLSVGWLALTAGAAYAALATQLSCGMSDPFHLLIWHALPVIVVGFVGIVIGKLFIKKL